MFLIIPLGFVGKCLFPMKIWYNEVLRIAIGMITNLEAKSEVLMKNKDAVIFRFQKIYVPSQIEIL